MFRRCKIPRIDQILGCQRNIRVILFCNLFKKKNLVHLNDKYLDKSIGIETALLIRPQAMVYTKLHVVYLS